MIEIDVKKLKNGLYFYSIEHDQELIVKKLLISKQ